MWIGVIIIVDNFGGVHQHPHPMDVVIASGHHHHHQQQQQHRTTKPSLTSSFGADNNNNNNNNGLSATSRDISSKTVPNSLWMKVDYSQQRQEQKYESSSLVFQVATWNLWFGPRGDGEPHVGPRMRAIYQLLVDQNNNQQQQQHPQLWCIGFQEVIHESFDILQPLLAKAGYQIFQQPSTSVSYRCALAVHDSLQILDHGWYPYSQTVMDRGFLYVRAVMPGTSQQLLFTTTHLESYTGPRYTGAKQRPQQLQEMELFCNRQIEQHAPSLRVAIMTGDMNWDDESGTKALDPVMSTVMLLSDKWKDSWLETSPNAATGYTYDGKLNPMLLWKDNVRRRFDRILVRFGGDDRDDSSKTSIVSSTELIGTKALPGLVWSKYNHDTRTTVQMPTLPSDHFGYIATLLQVD